MRAAVMSCFLSIVLLVPNVGTAQVYSRPADPPAINAAGAAWYVNGEPIFYGGTLYYPTGPSIFFNGNVMVASGSYRGIPLYADSTIEPWSLVYVPVGGSMMRPYERLRVGELASTTGSRTPSFPVQGPRDLPPSIADIGLTPDGIQQTGTGGATVNRTPPSDPTYTGLRPKPKTMEAIPGAARNEGFWINFNEARWYYQGPLVRFDADRFEPFGSYRGFTVYKDRKGSDGVIFVTAVKDGPLVPYAKR